MPLSLMMTDSCESAPRYSVKPGINPPLDKPGRVPETVSELKVVLPVLI